MLGGLELPKLSFDLAIPEFPNPFKGLKKKLGELKEGTIEFFELEQLITDENNKQLDAKNNIVKTNGDIKTSVDAITPAEKKAREEAEKLRETFKDIGASVKNDLVNNLTDAITEGKSFGDAMKNVLGNLKKRLVNLALDRAISGIGSALMGGKKGGKGIFGGFLSGLFGKERGGRVSAGGAFVVGERGPEILQMGSKGGTVIPNSQIGGGGDSVVNNISVSVDASGSTVSGSSSRGNELGQQIAAAIQLELIKQKRAGGLLA